MLLVKFRLDEVFLVYQPFAIELLGNLSLSDGGYGRLQAPDRGAALLVFHRGKHGVLFHAVVHLLDHRICQHFIFVEIVHSLLIALGQPLQLLLEGLIQLVLAVIHLLQLFLYFP